ncbi:peroxiredoxin [Halorarius halobius]|uniref:peroxiredoxin n=1 Tax=Halorarius halobius TaxID=2962671 RepID=UPI0020CE16F5|nr:peroxiredoxin [Halorarius halobius]
MLDTGTEAPRFELPNQDGETVALPEEGTVVVYFYPRADTPGCTTQACSFRDRWDDYRDRGVRVFGVSDDPVADLAAFAEKHDLPVELLSDELGEVARAYDSYGQKTVFGNEVEGVFRNTYVVRDGEVALAYEGVDPEDHADAVLADIDAL